MSDNDSVTMAEVHSNKERYKERVQEWNNSQEDVTLGSAIFPRETGSDMAARAFHELMMDRGMTGIEYTQEALHQNGGYFDEYFDSVNEAINDFERFDKLNTQEDLRETDESRSREDQ